MAESLGEILVEHGKLDRDNLNRALRLDAESHESLETLLVQLGMVSDRDIAEALAAHLDRTLTAAEAYADAPALGEQVPPEFLRQARCLPLAQDQEQVVVAVANPLDDYAVEALQLATGKRVVWQVGVASEIESAFQRQYANGTSSMAQIVEGIGTSELDETEDIRHLKDLASEAPIIRVVNLLITRALECSASDIHIEPFENALKVRYRVDGVLRDVEAPPVRSSAAVISRIKVMANLNIAERRLPQDGRIRIRIAGREFDMRISTTPTMHGESVVLRILDKATVPLDFRALGFASELLPVFEELLMRPHGIILSTGPTGSGKTTTLYAALSTLNTPDRKVVTVEDPVEYQLNGINQIQIKPQIGLTFANALRSILRQDPDVIMVGEMRDLETCKIAVQAALTGHKVFSTLHTNDAASSVTRLLDMGIEDYLLTSTLNGVLAQRLVRTLCPQCKKPYLALPELVEELRLSRFSRPGEVTLFEAVGCGHCDRSGYRGRTSILELLVMSDPVRQIVLNRGDAGAINRAAVDHGMTSMYEDGLRKAVAGLTTIEEVVRVTQES